MSFTNARYRLDRIVTHLGTDDAGGSLITLRQRTAGAISPVTGLLSGAATTDYVIPGVVSVFESEFPHKQDIEDTIYQTVISALRVTFTPALGDEVIDANGVTYRVRKIEPGYIGPYIGSWLLYLEA